MHVKIIIQHNYILPTSGLIIRFLSLLSIKAFVIYYFNSAIAIKMEPPGSTPGTFANLSAACFITSVWGSNIGDMRHL